MLERAKRLKILKAKEVNSEEPPLALLVVNVINNAPRAACD